MCDFYVVLGVECVTSVRGFGCGLCDFHVVLDVECVTSVRSFVVDCVISLPFLGVKRVTSVRGFGCEMCDFYDVWVGMCFFFLWNA